MRASVAGIPAGRRRLFGGWPCLVPVILLVVSAGPFPGFAAGLTNRAIWSWSDLTASRWWTNTTAVVTNLYRFQLFTPGYDPSNRYPLPGETVRIPMTLMNVGGETMSNFDLVPYLPSEWVAAWSVTVDGGVPKVFEPGDTNAFVFSPLLPGQESYLWLNITIRTGIPAGSYVYRLTNRSGDWPYQEVLTNVLAVFLQNVTVLSAHDGGHTIRVFDGTRFLGDRNVAVDIRTLAPASSLWLYYDVGKDPTGRPPDGTLTNNRRVPFTDRGGFWRAVIPADDPEIVEGVQVRFVVVVDGKVFGWAPGVPYAYGVKRYHPQPSEQEGPLILTSNVGDFTVVPVRVLWSMPSAGHVNITVYNLRGEVVRRLVNGRLEAGEHAVAWDGRNDAGREVAEGLYFVAVNAPGLRAVRKTLFVKGGGR